MKSVTIRAGDRVRIISKTFNSIPMSYSFDIEPVVSGQRISGSVEICGSNWLFPKPEKSQELAASNSVDKGMWDSFYSVYVTPEVDVVVRMGNFYVGKVLPIFLAALLITGIGAALVFFAGT